MPNLVSIDLKPNYSANPDCLASHFSRVRAMGPPSINRLDVVWPTNREWKRLFRDVQNNKTVDTNDDFATAVSSLMANDPLHYFFSPRGVPQDLTSPKTMLFMLQLALNAYAEHCRVFGLNRVRHKIDFIRVCGGTDLNPVSAVFNGRCLLQISLRTYEALEGFWGAYVAGQAGLTQRNNYWAMVNNLYCSINPNPDITNPAWAREERPQHRPIPASVTQPEEEDEIVAFGRGLLEGMVTATEGPLGAEEVANLLINGVVPQERREAPPILPADLSRARAYREREGLSEIPCADLHQLIMSRGPRLSVEVRNAIFELLIAEDVGRPLS